MQRHAKAKTSNAQQSAPAVDKTQVNSSEKGASPQNQRTFSGCKQFGLSLLTYPRLERRYVMQQGLNDPLMVAALGAPAVLEHTSCTAATVENVEQLCLGCGDRGLWQFWVQHAVVFPVLWFLSCY